MRCTMKNKSRKQKGRRLQNYARDRLLKTFKHLRKKDVEVAVMSQPGADIILSKVGKKLIPWQAEQLVSYNCFPISELLGLIG